MSYRLFVDGLSSDTTDELLERSFGIFGQLTSAEVVRDQGTGEPSGFGYVTFADDLAAMNALTWMNGIELAHGTLKVFEAEAMPLAGSEASRWPSPAEDRF